MACRKSPVRVRPGPLTGCNRVHARRVRRRRRVLLHRPASSICRRAGATPVLVQRRGGDPRSAVARATEELSRVRVHLRPDWTPARASTHVAVPYLVLPRPSRSDDPLRRAVPSFLRQACPVRALARRDGGVPPGSPIAVGSRPFALFRPGVRESRTGAGAVPIALSPCDGLLRQQRPSSEVSPPRRALFGRRLTSGGSLLRLAWRRPTVICARPCARSLASAPFTGGRVAEHTTKTR